MPGSSKRPHRVWPRGFCRQTARFCDVVVQVIQNHRAVREVTSTCTGLLSRALTSFSTISGLMLFFYFIQQQPLRWLLVCASMARMRNKPSFS